jgi:hypothetical protein
MMSIPTLAEKGVWFFGPSEIDGEPTLGINLHGNSLGYHEIWSGMTSDELREAARDLLALADEIAEAGY